MNLTTPRANAAKSGGKLQLTVHLAPETDAALREFCEHRRVSMSLAVNDALRAKLFPEEDPDRCAESLRAPNLDALAERLDFLEQEVRQGQELIALYIQMWFIYDAPKLSEAEYKARAVVAKQRFERFMEAFILRFAQGDSLIDRYQTPADDVDDSEVTDGPAA